MNQPPPPSPAPINRDIICTGCEYNLRGLTMDGRCPECARPVRESCEFPQSDHISKTLAPLRSAARMLSVFLFVAGVGMTIMGMTALPARSISRAAGFWATITCAAPIVAVAIGVSAAQFRGLALKFAPRSADHQMHKFWLVLLKWCGIAMVILLLISVISEFFFPEAPVRTARWLMLSFMRIAFSLLMVAPMILATCAALETRRLATALKQPAPVVHANIVLLLGSLSAMGSVILLMVGRPWIDSTWAGTAIQNLAVSLSGSVMPVLVIGLCFVGGALMWRVQRMLAKSIRNNFQAAALRDGQLNG